MKERTVLSVATETYSKPHHTAQKMKFSIAGLVIFTAETSMENFIFFLGSNIEFEMFCENS